MSRLILSSARRVVHQLSHKLRWVLAQSSCCVWRKRKRSSGKHAKSHPPPPHIPPPSAREPSAHTPSSHAPSAHAPSASTPSARAPSARAPPPSSNRNRTDRQLGTTLTPHHYVPKQKNVRFLFFETRVLPSERNKALQTRDGCYRNRLAWHWFKAICTFSWTKLTVEVTVCAVYSLVLT